MSTDDIIKIIIFVVAAFLPPLLYLIWIRNTERYGKEPWGTMLKTFFWGAIIAVFIAIFLSLILLYIYQIGLSRIYVSYGQNPTLDLLFLAVIIAPFSEEFAKGLGVYTARNDITEEEDGLVYGAACGLGFAATENLMYGVIAFSQASWVGFFTLIIIRSIASALLHASATSMMGYGVGKTILWREKFNVLPYYLTAVGMHASFNFLASIGAIYESTYGPTDPYTYYAHIFSLLIVVFFAIVAIGLIRKKIKGFDKGKTYPYSTPHKSK